MDLWTDKVGRDERFLNLPNDRLGTLAVTCVDRAIAETLARSSTSLGSESVRVFMQARQILTTSLARQGLDTLKSLRGEVDAIAPDEDSPEDLIFGYTYVLMAILHCIGCLLGEETRQNAGGAMSAAYQSLIDVELNSARVHAGGQLLGPQEDQFELNSLFCQQEISFQLVELEKLV